MQIRMMRSIGFGIIGAILLFSPHSAQAGSQLWSAPDSTQSSIHQAYLESGGKGSLGTAQGSTQIWKDGCIQDYAGGRSKTAAIIMPKCTPADPKPASSAQSQPFIVKGEFWDYTKANGSTKLGTPLSNDQLLDEGRWQTFSGGNWGLTDLYQAPDTAEVYSIRSHIRTWYLDQGGPSGQIGWPISEEYAWQGELRQDFQMGSLVWRTETGTRPLVSWSNGKVLASPTVDPAHYLIREFNSLKITSDEQLNRCYGGRTAVQGITPDELSLTQKKYPTLGVAADCVTPREQAALNWATNQLQSKNSAWSNQLGTHWSGRCETFVELAFGTRARAWSATEHYNWRLKRGQIHTDHAAPAGAVVFYGGSADGHVGVSIGGGLVISTQGYLGDALPIWQHQITGLSNPYLGWAYIDDSWPR